MVNEQEKIVTPCISETDRQAIEKLRSLVKHEITIEDFNDFDFLRWLNGYDYNYDAIVPKLIYHFRTDKCLDSFQRFERSEVMKKYWPSGMLGLTSGKDDNFVLIDCLGPLDGEGIMKSVSIYDSVWDQHNFVKYQIMPHIRKREAETGRQSGTIMVTDLENCPLNSTTFSLVTGPFKSLITQLQVHYPELAKKMLVVNAPSFMHILYRLVKPFLPEKTKTKIIVLGSDWKTEILKYIEPDRLPVHWGGTLVGELDDPKYGVVIPEKVPEDFYWIHSEKLHPANDQLQTLVVPAGHHRVLNFHVTHPGAILKWYFLVNMDFGFGVFFSENEKDDEHMENLEWVYPQFHSLCGSCYRPEIDEISCKKVGFYKIWFANKQSWISKLKVRYFAHLVENDNNNDCVN